MSFVISTRDTMFLMHIVRFFSTFYTCWWIIFHILYFLWYLPNTRIIALFIFVMSQGFTYVYPHYWNFYEWKNRKWLLWIDFLLHWIRIFILPINFSYESIILLVISVIWYVSINAEKVIIYYSDPVKVTRQIFKRWS